MSITGLFDKFITPAPPRYYREDVDGYLVSIGVGDSGTEITAEDYEAIRAVISDKPTPPDGYDYRLTSVLEWESYELLPEPDPEEQPVDDPAEALALLLGGGDNG